MNEISFGRSPLVEPMQPNSTAPAQATVTPPLLQRLQQLAARWKWLLVGALAISLLLGLIVTLLMTPKYTAMATIEIQREGARVVNVQGVEPEASPMDQEFYQTQYGLLQSQGLMERIVNDLKLHQNADFFYMFGEDEIAQEVEGAPRGSADKRQEHIRAAAKILNKNVSIDPLRLSRLVHIGFTSPDPVLSTRVVNAWTKLFIETSLDRRFEATSYARKFLEERLGQLRGRLEESERALVQYAANERIVSIPANTAGGAQVETPLIAQDLASANADLNGATAARVAAQSRLKGAGGSTSEGLGNQAISDLRTRRAQLAADRAKLLSQFEPGYSPIQALSDQIADIDRSIAREEARIRETFQNTYAAASTREAASRARVGELELAMLDTRRRTIQYNIFQREVDTNRQLYDALLQRYKEIGVAGGVGVNNISIVDQAQVPEKPSSPNLLLNLFLSALVGFAAGIGLALLLDQADEAISDPRDLEAVLGLPLLGTIPRASEEDPVDELKDPKSALVEAYLSTQTLLSFTTQHGVPRSLTVTSTRPGEGKSTTTYALARTLARTGRRVVLIDGDMRSPSQHEIFQASNDRGLSNYLAGDDELLSFVQTPGDSDGLSLIPAGPTPPNAAELLTSGRFAKLIDDLTSRYDHVIVDAPPVMGLADAPLIASNVEGCILVIKSHDTRTSMARVALQRLQASRARVLGGLLTMFESKHTSYGYEYGYGYGERDGHKA